MIYFYCPEPTTPSGGVWFIHRLVHLLNEAGRPARVLLPRAPAPVWWDIHPIPAEETAVRNQRLEAGDTVFVPEGMWHFGLWPEGPRYIVFLQNYIWLNLEHFKSHPTEVLVCSRFLYNWCTRELGLTPLGIVRPYLNPLLWRPTPKQSNRTLILARRDSAMAHMLAMAAEANGFPIDFVDEPLTQWELFEHLAEAEYYVHGVEPEGFPMICLEAMRSGTIVVGTTGGGGNEFMHNDETALVTPGPLLGRYDNPGQFVDRVMERLRRLRDDAALREKLWKQAYDWSQRYTPGATTLELLAALSAKQPEAG